MNNTQRPTTRSRWSGRLLNAAMLFILMLANLAPSTAWAAPTTPINPRSPALASKAGSDFTRGSTNPGFEQPGIAANQTAVRCDSSQACSALYYPYIPGWWTTDSNHVIELWGDGYNGHPAASGVNFAELNASENAALYQDICMLPGEAFTYALNHRGRLGADQLLVKAGPSGGALTSIGDFTDGNTAWTARSGNYTNPGATQLIRFQMEAGATTGGDPAVGNLLDDVQVNGLKAFVEVYNMTYAAPESTLFQPKVILKGVLTSDQTVTLAVTGGTATAGVDFTLETNLTIPAGIYDGTYETGVSIVLEPFGDSLPEADETINIEISVVSSGLVLASTTTCGGAPVDGFVYTIQNDDAPIATSDSYTATLNTPLTIAAPGVLGNDAGVGLTAVKVSDPAHGTLSLSANGSFTYTPATDFVGSDSFTYKANDGTLDSSAATVSITVENPLGADDLIAYWKFDETSGTSAADSSGFARTGTLSSEASFVNTPAPITSYANPGALSLNGASMVSVPNGPINRLTDNFTLMGWVRRNSFSTMTVASTARAKTLNGWSWRLEYNTITFTAYDGYNDVDYASDPLKLPNGQWAHLAVVVAGGKVSFYFDGVPVGTKTLSKPLTADTDDQMQIGAGTSWSSNDLQYGFNGLLDDVRVYSRGLSASEIADRVGVEPCSELVLRGRVGIGEASPTKTITLDGECTYTLTTFDGDPMYKNGLSITQATAIEGNGAIIQRTADPNAPLFRLMQTSPMIPSITISNLTFKDGKVDTNGGGLAAGGKLTLNNVRFENNQATSLQQGLSVLGGALYASQGVTADRCTFIRNAATVGGAIYTQQAPSRITNSIFADNSAQDQAAAIIALNDITLLNNTFTNQALILPEALLSQGSTTVQNNIFENFSAAMTAGSAEAAISEDYNLYANISVRARAINSGTYTSGSNSRIAAAPGFIDPALDDYHLNGNSPAINQGTSAAGVTSDADGQPRPYGTRMDIGAYEYQDEPQYSLGFNKLAPKFVSAGAPFRFSLAVFNQGGDTLSDLVVTEALPDGATYVAGSATDGGTYNSSTRTLTWKLAPLGPGLVARVWYEATATQALVSNAYQVTSQSRPELNTDGLTFTTPFKTAWANGFFPDPDGFGAPNWGAVSADKREKSLTAEDMVKIYGEGVCATRTAANVCVLSATAEALRQQMIKKGDGGHCSGVAAASLKIFDDPLVKPSDFRSDATLSYQLLQDDIRRIVQIYYSSYGEAPVTPVTVEPRIVEGAKAIIDAWKADPNRRFILAMQQVDPTRSGHAVTPYALVEMPLEAKYKYWLYVYDSNMPGNFDRVVKIDYTTGAWIYEGGATNPNAPPGNFRDDTGSLTNHINLQNFRMIDAYPKVCNSACPAPAMGKLAPANGSMVASRAPTFQWEALYGAQMYLICINEQKDQCEVLSGYPADPNTTSWSLPSFLALKPSTTYYWQVAALDPTGRLVYSGGSKDKVGVFQTPAADMAAASKRSAASLADLPVYQFHLDGEGSLMITRSDGKRAGIDPATGQFIAEIPGAEYIPNPGGLGLNIPGEIRIAHEHGMTYRLRVADTVNQYYNALAQANLSILGPGFVTQLEGLKIDSLLDTENTGNHDVLNVTFDPDNHRVTYQSSTLDSDTPTLSMAISKAQAPDFTLKVGGVQIAPEQSLAMALNPATGQMSIEDNDPATSTFSVDAARTNEDGSSLTYHSQALNAGSNTGINLELGPSWTGGAPAIGYASSLSTTADSYTAFINKPLSVGGEGVLSNDAGARPLQASLVSGPTHGTLLLNPDGSFTYTPNAGYLGQDSFTYQAASGLYKSNATTVAISVVLNQTYLPVIRRAGK